MKLTSTPEELQKASRAIAALVVLVLIAGVTTIAVRAAYGAFSDDLVVHTTFERAGQSLRPGSDVKYRGVNVGKVRKVRLVDRQVRVDLQIHKAEKIPANTAAAVRAKTLFGEKYIELAVRKGDRGPYLHDGDDVASGGVGVEVEQLVSGTDGLLRRVDITELATLTDELTKAAQGEGAKVARLIDKSVGATAAIDDTLDQQLVAVDSFQRFARQYRDVAPQLNGSSRNLNELLPTFNAARADYERLLTTLRPFADHLAEFVEVNEVDLGRLLDNGDNIVRVLTARKANISETIEGLARYTYVLGNAVSKEVLPDGSRLGYLKLFVDAGDLNRLICATLGQTGPAPQLSEVRAALAAAAPILACDGDGGAAGAGASPAGTGSGAAPAGGGGAANSTQDPAQTLNDLAVGQVARPDQAAGSGTVASLLGPLLSGAP